MARKKLYDENGNEVKRGGGCFKWGCLGAIGFFAVIMLISIGVSIGSEGTSVNTASDQQTTEQASGEEQNTEKTQQEVEEQTEEQANEAAENPEENQETEAGTFTRGDYDNLVVGDIMNGGGTSYDDIVAQFGEPMTVSESQVGDMTSIFASYPAEGDLGANVSLSFTDGQLTSKSQFGLEQ